MTMRNHEAKYTAEKKYRIFVMKDEEGAVRV